MTDHIPIAPDASPPRRRSGDVSRHPRFDVDELFDIVSDTESAEQAADAIRAFLGSGEEAIFARAVAVYVRSAQARGEPVERVLAALKHVLDNTRPPQSGRTRVQRDSDRARTSELLLRGLLLSFYGAAPVADGFGIRGRRTPGTRDAPAQTPTHRADDARP